MSERLNYRVSGNASGPTLALLHGFMSCNAQWLANEPTLGQAFRLVLIELWGHGDSPAPADPAAYTIERYLEEFEAIRAEVGASEWYPVGQSYGAGLMLNYAIAHPERCPAVVTTNSRSAYGVLPERRDGAGPNPLDDPEFPLRKLPYHPVHARRFPQNIKDALVDKADRMIPRTVRLGGAMVQDLNFRDRLDAVPVPVMIANGIYEKSFQDDVAYLEARYTDLTIVPLEGGHSVNIEAAPAFDAAVEAFLLRAARDALPHPRRRA